MKKKISVPMIVIAAHLLLCIFLSFPWDFLEGVYFGFLATFFILWGLSLPAVSACIGLIASLGRRKCGMSFGDIVSAVSSGLILLAYLASVLGLWKNTPLNFVYIAILALTVLLWAIAIARWIKRRKKKSTMK